MQIFAVIIALVGAAAFEGMALLYRRRIIPAGPLIALATSILLTMVGLTIVGVAPGQLVIVNQASATNDQ
ncbi:hypothetical protein [Sphingomonas sp. BK235]|uniref:hypothetical protein n=1 Tax=Sphingomonas sp. BK235 TaxID=2512131 RepID=UPI00104B5C03|nr:hypothetical protein [Sphingomonas sp. BK235]TCP30367.1 hypothetical protein EV292_11340 [Sphingomonas sp. BK235]